LIAVLTGLMLFTYITERIADRYIISYDVLLLGIILASLTVYFLPSIIADVRHHSQSLAIFVLNILLGWTLLGWIAALFWACTNDVKHHMAPSIVPAANSWVEDYDLFEVRPLFLEERPDQHRAMA
jgi:RsiW-degrading membrane proteinase PrsW (M82 family)